MKKYIIGFLVGAIVFGSIGVTATVLYNSSEIGFTPSDSSWNVNNVEDAINSLYNTPKGNTITVSVDTPGSNTIIYDFQPKSLTINCSGVSNVAYSSIMNWDEENGYTYRTLDQGAWGSTGYINVNDKTVTFTQPYNIGKSGRSKCKIAVVPKDN